MGKSKISGYVGDWLSLKSLVNGLKSEQVIDALRNTLAVVFPLCLFFSLGMPAAAIGIGTGTLLMCPTDLPGNRSDKLQGAWVGVLVFTLTALLIGWSLDQPFALAICMTLLTFTLMMFGALGQRLALIGTMAVILATFTIGLHPKDVIAYGFYVCIGGIWYYLISLLQIWFFPYRSLNKAIGQCIRSTAALMRLRATGYDPLASLSGFNERNIRLHLKLTTNHELIRRLLLGDRWAMKFIDTKAKRLLQKATGLIDLYEQVSAVHHDYFYLRAFLSKSGALPLISRSIIILSAMLENGKGDRLALQSCIAKLEELSLGSEEEQVLIQKLLGNLKETIQLVEMIISGTEADLDPILKRSQEFLPVQALNLPALISHLSMDAAVFRFSLRLSILMLISVLVIRFLPTGSYGYWLPLTLVIVSRPTYGLTKRRNIERFLGTVLGLAIGWLVLLFSFSNTVLLLVGVFFLFMFFAFVNLRYWVSALSITAAVVICLNVYHGQPLHIVADRLIFTVLGCLLGLLATFIFPIWQVGKVRGLVEAVLVANQHYLQTVMEERMGEQDDFHQVRLARKQAYLALSQLSEVLTLSGTEPKWKRMDLMVVRQVQLLCFQCNGLIASVASSKRQGLSGEIEKSIQFIMSEMTASLNGCRKLEMKDWQTSTLKETAFAQEPMDLTGVVVRLKQYFA